MKRVVAVIKPFRLDAVIEALRSAGGAGSLDLLVEEVRGFGRQKGHLELYSGREYSISFLPKVRLEFTVGEERLETVIAALAGAARTGRIGDGKLFVFDAAPGAAGAEMAEERP